MLFNIYTFFLITYLIFYFWKINTYIKWELTYLGYKKKGE